MPKTSVIITTFNRPHLLPRAVASARNAGTDIEVVVVDDASRDRTAQVCRGIEGIRYVRLEQNLGTAGARNVGILASSGEYLSFHDDDDTRFPGSLDQQVRALETDSKAQLCYGPVVIGNQDGSPTARIEPKHCPSGDIFWDLLTWNPIMCIASVFRRSCLHEIGLLDTNLKGIDDWDLWIRIAERGQVVAMSEPLAIWRMALPTSGQGSSVPHRLLSQFAHHQKHLLGLPRAAVAPLSKRSEARRQFLDKASDWLIWEGATWLPKGGKRYCLRNVLAALWINPSRALRPWTFYLLLRSCFPDGSLSRLETNC